MGIDSLHSGEMEKIIISIRKEFVRFYQEARAKLKLSEKNQF